MTFTGEPAARTVLPDSSPSFPEVVNMPYPTFHFILVVDIEGFGKRTVPVQQSLRKAMYEVVQVAFEDTNLDWDARRPARQRGGRAVLRADDDRRLGGAGWVVRARPGRGAAGKSPDLHDRAPTPHAGRPASGQLPAGQGRLGGRGAQHRQPAGRRPAAAGRPAGRETRADGAHRLGRDLPWGGQARLPADRFGLLR